MVDRLNIVRPQHPSFMEFYGAFDLCLQSGIVTNDGPYVRSFEKALTDFFGIPTIVFCNGQTALMTMLYAKDIHSGRVICPSFTFSATPHAITWCGATPRFVDINEDTLCMDPEAVRWAITPRTRAVLGVDPYGIKWNPLGIPRGNGVHVLCDAAPAFGTSLWCDAQVFSFHATKAFSTMEGGAIQSRDEAFIERCRQIRNFGQDNDGNCEYPGLNGKMMEICAIIGLRQLEDWKYVSGQRRAIATAIDYHLRDIPGLKAIKPPEGQEPIWLYRPILIDRHKFGKSRDQVVEQLKTYDIHVRKYYTPCHKLKCYEYLNCSLPVTEKIAEQIIALPVYNDMKIKEVDRIGSALREIQSGG